MGIALMIVGGILAAISILGVMATLNNAIALADSLLLGVIAAVLIGCGAVVETVSNLRRDFAKKNSAV